MRWAALFIACAGLSAGAPEEPLRLTLEQAAARRPADLGPAQEGRRAIVIGQVSGLPIRFFTAKYALVGIQDGQHGLLLQGAEDRFDDLAPGHWIEAEGVIFSRAGLPVLRPERVTAVRKARAPEPVAADIGQFRSFHVLGRLVTGEFTVTQLGENSGGIYLNVGQPDDPLKIYAPLPARNIEWRFPGISPRDRIRVTGFASQYCPVPPYNRRFEILIHSPSDVVRIDRGWMLPAWALAMMTGGALSATLFLWQRERRHRRHREMLRHVYELGEEILGSGGPADILKSLSPSVPRSFRVTSVQMYVHNKNSKTLDPVPGADGAAPEPVAIDPAIRGIEAALVSCLRNRALLSIPDTKRSPFAGDSRPAVKGPRSIFLIPMLAQGEVMGVLQLAHEKKTRNFGPLERLLAQHLGNHVGVAIKLHEQRSIREQLFRTEKVAAVGRLITGVVNELQAPLSSIASLSERALSTGAPGAPALAEIYSEAQRASSIVNRLVSFDRPEQVDTRPLDVNRLLRSLIEFRELEWKARGIHVRNFLREGPLFVVGSQGQLEQVFLSLIVHAEQSLADSEEKIISLGSNLLAKRVLIEIAYTSAGPDGSDPFMADSAGQFGALDLGVCRSIMAGHEGELRLTRARASESRFEIEMPWSPMDAEARPAPARQARDNSRQLTAIVMESDELVARQLINLLSARAYRVVPVRSAEEGLDLAQRLRFDIALCSSRLPGLNWVELLTKTRAKVGSFILLTDGYDTHVAGAARDGGYFVLSKPLEENELDRVLDRVLNPEQQRREVTSV
jgi:signal transduction histidine kinase/CheY-like chemotaxis protein